MSRPHALKRLVAAALLVSLCSAFCLTSHTRVRAANNPLPTISNTKISPDLRQLILSGNGDARVKVIVQSKPSSSAGLLGGLLNTVGGLLVGVTAGRLQHAGPGRRSAQHRGRSNSRQDRPH